MSRRFAEQRGYRRRAKHGYVHAVLTVHTHRTIAVPFVAFLYDGAAMRAELLEGGELKLHGMRNGIAAGQYSPLPPDEWPDQVCVFMAKRALIEGEI